MTYYTWRKKFKGEDTSWRITRRTNVPNGTFSTLYFVAVSLRIHVEFLNDERGKEKDRWCCRLYYWLNPSYYWQFFKQVSLLICWLPIGDFRQNFGRQNFCSLDMATKMVAAWNAVLSWYMYLTFTYLLLNSFGQISLSFQWWKWRQPVRPHTPDTLFNPLEFHWAVILEQIQKPVHIYSC